MADKKTKKPKAQRPIRHKRADRHRVPKYEKGRDGDGEASTTARRVVRARASEAERDPGALRKQLMGHQQERIAKFGYKNPRSCAHRQIVTQHGVSGGGRKP